MGLLGALWWIWKGTALQQAAEPQHQRCFNEKLHFPTSADKKAMCLCHISGLVELASPLHSNRSSAEYGGYLAVSLQTSISAISPDTGTRPTLKTIDRLQPSKTLLAAACMSRTESNLFSLSLQNLLTQVAGKGRGLFSFLALSECILSVILVPIFFRKPSAVCFPLLVLRVINSFLSSMRRIKVRRASWVPVSALPKKLDGRGDDWGWHDLWCSSPQLACSLEWWEREKRSEQVSTREDHEQHDIFGSLERC